MLQERGILVPLPCEVCGSEDVERHHQDYSKPMLVRWLCRPHHKAVDSGEIVLPVQCPVALTMLTDFYLQDRPNAIPSGFFFVRPA